MDTTKILIIDDEDSWIQTIATNLTFLGFQNVQYVNRPCNAINFIENNEVDVVLLDLKMPGISGEELLPRLLQRYPDLVVIIVTAFDQTDKAVSCVKEGAFDFLSKADNRDKILAKIRRGIHHARFIKKQGVAAQTESDHPAFSKIITQSNEMRKVFGYVQTIAPTGMDVLITGETGTGKELIARAIHTLSMRKGEFVPVNIAGLDGPVFSDTLFGHRVGAYTGANAFRSGLIRKAENGTLFLDEIGDLSEDSQTKLLRLLQEREFYPLGGDTPEKTTARIVCATHANFEETLKSKAFRLDLFHRLQSHHIHLPPLRERMEDLEALVLYFIDEACDALSKNRMPVTEASLARLAEYDFPGNIRELRSIVHKGVVGHRKGWLSLASPSFKPSVGQSGGNFPVVLDHSKTLFSGFKILPTLEEANEQLIQEALRRMDGNRTRAAQSLGIARSTIQRTLNKRGGGE